MNRTRRLGTRTATPDKTLNKKQQCQEIKPRSSRLAGAFLFERRLWVYLEVLRLPKSEAVGGIILVCFAEAKSGSGNYVPKYV